MNISLSTEYQIKLLIKWGQKIRAIANMDIPGPEIIRLFRAQLNCEISTAHKTKMLRNKYFSCFQTPADLIVNKFWHFNIYEHDISCSVELRMEKVV